MAPQHSAIRSQRACSLLLLTDYKVGKGETRLKLPVALLSCRFLMLDVAARSSGRGVGRDEMVHSVSRTGRVGTLNSVRR